LAEGANRAALSPAIGDAGATRERGIAWQAMRRASTSRITIAAAAVAGATVAGKLIAGVRDLAIAYRFGVGDETDAFVVALLLPSFVGGITMASLCPALTPLFIRIRSERGPEAAEAFGGQVLGMVLLFLLLVLGVMELLAGPLLEGIARGFSPQKLQASAALLVVLAPLLLFQGTSGIWAALLNANRSFSVVEIAPLLTPTVAVAYLLSVRSPTLHEVALLMLVSGAVETLWLRAQLRRTGVNPRLRLPALTPEIRLFLRDYLPILAAVALINGRQVVDQAIAGTLAAGSVTVLSYGAKIVGPLMTVLAVPLAAILLPVLAEKEVAGDSEGASRTVWTTIALVAGGSCALTGALVFLSPPLVEFLFQRGAFTAADAQLVADVQRAYALQIPFYLVTVVGLRALNSRGRNGTILLIMGVAFLLNIAFDLIFAARIGVSGIAFATSCVQALTAVALVIGIWVLPARRITIEGTA
jgi:putative peptidoglycan lipid II flippase